MDARVQECFAGCGQIRQRCGAVVASPAERTTASSAPGPVAGPGAALDARRTVSSGGTPRGCAAPGGHAVARRYSGSLSPRFDDQEQRGGIRGGLKKPAEFPTYQTTVGARSSGSPSTEVLRFSALGLRQKVY